MGNGDVKIILTERHFKADIIVTGLRKTRVFAEDPETGRCLELLLREKIELGIMEFNLMAAITAANDREMMYEFRSRLEGSYEDRMKIIREFGDKIMRGSGAIHKQPQ